MESVEVVNNKFSLYDFVVPYLPCKAVLSTPPPRPSEEELMHSFLLEKKDENSTDQVVIQDER